MRSKTVRWTSEEVAAVAVKTAALMIDQGIHVVPDSRDKFGRGMFLGIARWAMREVLPRDRQRSVHTSLRLGKPVIALVTKTLAAARNKPAAAPSPAPLIAKPPTAEIQPPPPAPVQPAASEPAGNSLELEEMSPVALVARLADVAAELGRRAVLSVDKLAQSLSGLQARVSQDIDALQELQSEEFARQQAEIAALNRRILDLEGKGEGNGVINAPEITVVVLGCRKYEFDHVVNAFKSSRYPIKFKHFDQDASPRQFEADYVVSLKWLNHSWDSHARNAVKDPQHYKFLNGGVKTAIDTIHRFAEQHFS